MSPIKRILMGALAAPLVLAAGTAWATPEEDRLREQLRTVVLQLRELQDSQAAAAVPAAAPPADPGVKKALAAARAKLRASASRTEALQQQLTAQQAASDQALQAAQAELAQSRLDGARLAAEGQAAAAARDQFKASLDRQISISAACQAKNAELTRVAQEILSGYAKVSFGKVLLSREPFLGLKRVKLENAIQAYDDRIHDARCDAPPPASDVTPAPVRPTAKP